MSERITVHMIGSAHIDPVWLWRWNAGVVEALSTCRSAADLLDRHPDFIFTRSDVWVHELIERYDPELFERVRRFVADRRWYPAGGWYIQPDCNLPIAESYRRQIASGRRYFGERFDLSVDVGYNVDSFGHNASLPDILAEAGYRGYVMMRPGSHEKPLPSEFFRWRGVGGGEVATWRIQRSYNAATSTALEEQIEAAVVAAVPGVPHVMCFYGVGDHGGGPTEELVEWIEHHRDYGDGVELRFSSPALFFDQTQPYLASLPVVEGELQMHAIGCYTVVAEMKQTLRRAEHSLVTAERALEAAERESAADEDGSRDEDRSRIRDAWRTVLFNQFHDTLGGSSIAEAYRDARDQLGGAAATAEETAFGCCLDQAMRLPPDGLQRIIVRSFADAPQAGPIVHEPWIHPDGFSTPFLGRLLDEDGGEVAYQIVRQSAMLGPPRAMLWQDTVAPRQTRIYRLDHGRRPTSVDTDLGSSGSGIRSTTSSIVAGARGDTVLLRAGVPPESAASDRPLPETKVPVKLVSLGVYEDTSDTWSHRLDSFQGRELGKFEITDSETEETGPIRATIRVSAAFGSSRLLLRCSLFRNSAYVDLDLTLVWTERRAIAKLLVPVDTNGSTPPTDAGDHRVDGLPEGHLERPQDGKEYPFHEWTCVGSGLGVVTPDCFGFDGADGVLRFTLVRSPVYAWHDPTPLEDLESYHYTDQGTHRFRFRIVPGSSPKDLEAHAESMHRPPVVFDWTKGM